MPTKENTAVPASEQPERTPDPCIVVIFGASGDLTKRKLLPALYHLEQAGLLPKDFAVVGVAPQAAGEDVSARHEGWNHQRRRGWRPPTPGLIRSSTASNTMR